MEIYKAIKYIRLSYTEDKTVESDSVGNQRRMIDDFIAKHPEIEAVAEKIDDGYSGVLFDRPAFTEMIEMVKRGEANCIIVKDLSRLGRESIETGRYIRRFFPAYNVRFIAINDHFDTLQEDGDDLTVSVKNIMNEAYSRDISIKTRSALEAKRKNGDYVGAFPIYGYIKTGHQHKKLEIDPFAANVVKEIFRKRLEGYSALHIAEELNQMGVLSPMAYKKAEGQPYAKGGYGDQKDCKWSATTVLRILQDETYTGTLVQGRESTPHFKIKVRQAKPSSEWLRVENAHEAIVSSHDFDLVQRLKNIDTRTSPKSDAAYIFSGVLICGCCGGKMTRKTVRYKGEEYFYYYCRTGKKNGCDAGTMIKEADLIHCVQESLRGQIENVASLEDVLTSFSQERINQALIHEYQEHIEQCSRQLEEINQYKMGLYENLVNGCLSKEDYLTYKKQYTEKYDLLKKAIAQWEGKIRAVAENQGDRNRWISHFLQFAEMETIDRRVVVQLIQYIKVISKTEIHIEFRYKDEYRKAAAFAEQMMRREAV